MKLAAITRAMHTRGFSLGVAACVLVAACVYFYTGNTLLIAGDTGLGLPSANLWLPFGDWDFWAAMAGTALTTVLMMLLNKIYNVFRAMTSLFIGLFAIMQLATPGLMTQFYSGTVLAIVVPLCVMLLFSAYRDKGATRQVFLIFLLLSLFTATQYAYLVYIPVMLIGCAQMGIFTTKSLAAAFMGLLTPWIILIGFGLVDPLAIELPHPEGVFQFLDYDSATIFLAAIAFTGFVTLICYILNVLRTIAYNARARAVNGVFTMLLIFTVAAMALDRDNVFTYVPMLNFCAAMETTHYFSTHRADKSFIAIILIIAVYIALFLCQTVI